jgi:hypothetical protein
MLLEQALFTSAQTRQVNGYHLVARSAGIDDAVARELTRWSPSHGGIAGTEADCWSLNFFPVNAECLCLSRTVYGGVEYSRRGGWKVVTRMLLFTPGQLRGYKDDPLSLARAALALGHLRLEAAVPARLPRVELPDSTACHCLPNAWDGLPRGAGEVFGQQCASNRSGEAAALLASGERLALVGHAQPLAALEAVFAQLAPAERMRTSFTTGLRPSVHREFRLHFLPEAPGAATRQQLAAQGIRVC